MNNNDYQIQDKGYIKTLDRRTRFTARIYSPEQRAKVIELIGQGFTPTTTIVGKGLCTRKHWNVKAYSGRRGEGYRMISSYPLSSNFNSITYFIRLNEKRTDKPNTNCRE